MWEEELVGKSGGERERKTCAFPVDISRNEKHVLKFMKFEV
jgi:hypothetical protein